MMQFKQSPVVFNEEEHTYHLNGKRLLGITGLIHSVLGLGVYPDANDFVKDVAIPRAGSRGTAVHHAIQTYDTLGIMEPVQVVRTKFGCKERDNIRYEMIEWDVTDELENYIAQREGSIPLANELTVSDNLRYASQIDNVWLLESTQGIWLVDTKTNNINLYPTCGYFQSDYFSSGEEALKEYLSWQLSIYAELFEFENPGMKVEGLACNWLRGKDSALWLIERKPSELVWKLLQTEYHFTDNGVVFDIPDLSMFGINTLPAERQQQAIISQEIIDTIATLIAQEKESKAKLDELKKQLRQAMEAHNIKSWDSGKFRATIAADSERTTFDAERFKKDYPDIYEIYTTKKAVKGGFTLK